MNSEKDIIKILRLLRAVNASGERGAAVDERVDNGLIRSLRAAVPYLSISQQRSAQIIIKMSEISELLAKYRKLTIEEKNEAADFGKAVIYAVREQMNDEEKRMIDMFMKFSAISKIMTAANET